MNTFVKTVVATTLGITSAAQADVLDATYFNSNDYHYNIVHIPDFDQKRMSAPSVVGLPNDGAMHCVPTAVTNLMAYMANHGFDEISPGEANWQSQSNYNDASEAILFMGLFMQTDPTGGTGGADKLAGTLTWLDLAGVADQFTVTNQWASTTWAPQAHLMAGSGVSGSLVQYSYGRYDINGSISGQLIVERNGGHAVALAEAERVGGGPIRLECRDPSGGGNETTQSQFQRTIHDCATITVRPEGTPWLQRTHTRILGGNAGQVRLIDSYLSIRPKSGFSFSNTGLHTAPIGANNFETTNNSQTDAEVVGVSFDPDLLGFYVLYDDPDTGSELFHLDTVSDTWDPVFEGSGFMAVETGRCRNVIILERNEIHSIDPDARPITPTSMAFGSPAAAMACDDANDTIVVLSMTPNRFITFPQKLDGPFDQESVPASVPLAGDACIAIHPVSRERFLCSDANDCIYIVSRDTPPVVETICLPSVVNPRSLSFHDDGRLMIMTDNGIVELEETPNWTAVVGDDWGVLPAGFFAGVATSRTNFDPVTMSGPAFRHIDPDDLFADAVILDCPWDVNDDGTVNVLDLLELLQAWGSDDPRADVYPIESGDDMVNVLDLLALIGHWGGCP